MASGQTQQANNSIVQPPQSHNESKARQKSAPKAGKSTKNVPNTGKQDPLMLVGSNEVRNKAHGQ